MDVSADMLAADLDLAPGPSYWMPLGATDTEALACAVEVCTCKFRHLIHCGNAKKSGDLNETIWVENDFKVEFPILELDFVRNKFTAVTQRFTSTLHSGIVILHIPSNLLTVVEPGAMRDFPALLGFEPMAQKVGVELRLKRGFLEGGPANMPLFGWHGTVTAGRKLPSWWWHTGTNGTKGEHYW